jgi:hypothetical protein
MFTQTVDEISFVDPFEIQQAIVNFGDEVSDLQVFENFLAAVERRYLRESGPQFDNSRLKTNLKLLQGFSGELHHQKFNRHIGEIREGIRNWICELQQRDAGIAAYNVRRYCDDPSRKIEPIVYSALTRFYRTLGGSDSS